MSQANFEFNTFVKGLMTDANPLTYPENTSQDELNFVLNRDGSRQRRLGMNWDNNPGNSIRLRGNHGSYLWENVSQSGVSVFVVQSAFMIHFHLVDETGVLPSFLNLDISGMDTGNYQNGSDFPLSFSSGFGRLFVAGKHIEPFYVEIDEGFTYASLSACSIQIRDLDGLDDGYSTDYNPTKTEVNKDHIYNLINQGWGESHETGEYKVTLKIFGMSLSVFS